MEPVAERREDGLPAPYGDSSTALPVEPAVERREYRAQRRPVHDQRLAAMEPACDGGSTDIAQPCYLVENAPQWSPPLSGGSMWIYRQCFQYGTIPQWSPAVERRSTLV